MNEVGSVVIVGSSAAGVSVAESLRRHGYEREIVLIDEETAPPYDRPPLSKKVLCGEWEPGRTALLTDARFEAIGASHITGITALGLDIIDRQVRLDDGQSVPFGELVIATGVRSRPLPSGMPAGVHMLRTLDDARHLRRALEIGKRLLVIGGGFLGLEVAATARVMGLGVSVVEPTDEPLATRLGPTTARRLLDLHRHHEVDLNVGRSVSKFLVDASNSVRGVILDDGTQVLADVVLVAIGSIPNVDWLQGSGLDISNGVSCDSYCQAAPHVWAAGDVARWVHPGIGESIRLEHRTNATEQGDNVARNILGEGTPYAPVPFVWSDQFDVKIQSAGFLRSGCSETIHVGDPADGAYVLRFDEEDYSIGAVAWNAAKALIPVRRELAERFAILSSMSIEVN